MLEEPSTRQDDSKSAHASAKSAFGFAAMGGMLAAGRCPDLRRAFCLLTNPKATWTVVFYQLVGTHTVMSPHTNTHQDKTCPTHTPEYGPDITGALSRGSSTGRRG